MTDNTVVCSTSYFEVRVWVREPDSLAGNVVPNDRDRCGVEL